MAAYLPLPASFLGYLTAGGAAAFALFDLGDLRGVSESGDCGAELKLKLEILIITWDSEDHLERH